MSLLKPDLYYRSVTDIDLGDLARRGVRILLLDLDNTLVPRNTTVASKPVHDWVVAAKGLGFHAIIVSNNWHERVQNAADALHVPIIGRGTKPFPGVFRRALDSVGAQPADAAVIGDQVFTDILGGRLVGATTVLVTPMVEGTDLPHTRLLRGLERLVLRGRAPIGRTQADLRGDFGG